MNVDYRERALEDIQAIYQWRAQHSAVAANEIETAIFIAADRTAKGLILTRVVQ